MTPQQIKDNAPDGATHYSLGCFEGVYYYKFIFGMYVSMDRGFNLRLGSIFIKPL